MKNNFDGQIVTYCINNHAITQNIWIWIHAQHNERLK